jgi:hypothetical protein
VIPAKNSQLNSDLAQATYWSVAIFNANDVSNTNVPSPQPVTSDLFYSTDFATAPMPVTEAVFVIVEGRGPGFSGTGSAGTSSAGTGSAIPAAYRISVWRIVLHSPNDNSTTNTIPHKET